MEETIETMKPKPDGRSLSKEQKALIAREAQLGDVKEVAEQYGLSWITVRAWIAAYCRKEKTENPVTSAGPRWRLS